MKSFTPYRHLLYNEPSVRWARLYLGALFIVMAVSQLFAFEDYPAIVASYGIPVLSNASSLVAIVIVLTEIIAIPVLIGMKISPLVAKISVVAGWFTLIYWLAIGLWQSTTDEFIANAGLFGAKILLPQGWWLVSFMTALIILHGFSALCRPPKKK